MTWRSRFLCESVLVFLSAPLRVSVEHIFSYYVACLCDDGYQTQRRVIHDLVAV